MSYDCFRQVLAELRSVQAQLAEMVQLERQTQEHLRAGLEVVRCTVFNVNQRTCPTVFVILPTPPDQDKDGDVKRSSGKNREEKAKATKSGQGSGKVVVVSMFKAWAGVVAGAGEKTVKALSQAGDRAAKIMDRAQELYGTASELYTAATDADARHDWLIDKVPLDPNLSLPSLI